MSDTAHLLVVEDLLCLLLAHRLSLQCCQSVRVLLQSDDAYDITCECCTCLFGKTERLLEVDLLGFAVASRSDIGFRRKTAGPRSLLAHRFLMINC